MLNWKLYLLSLGIILHISPSVASSADFSDMSIDPFYYRFESASDIIYGEIVSISPADKKIDEFSSLASKNTKVAIVKIAKSWKGQKQGTLSFYFNFQSEAEPDISKRRKLIVYPLQVHDSQILYLRKISEDRILESSFGNFPISEPSWLKKNPDAQTLDELSRGSKLRDALVKIGTMREVKYFDESLKSK